jgi:quinolinate synthase
MNDLSRLLHVLDTRANEITIPEVVRARAEVSIRHTVEFASAA